MRYELDLIKKKAVLATNCVRDEKAIECLLDIIRLSEACLETMDHIDTNITDLALDMRRVTTDIQ